MSHHPTYDDRALASKTLWRLIKQAKDKGLWSINDLSVSASERVALQLEKKTSFKCCQDILILQHIKGCLDELGSEALTQLKRQLTTAPASINCTALKAAFFSTVKKDVSKSDSADPIQPSLTLGA